MMPKKKLTREEILAKKRIAERERKAKIKSDPDLYKLHKERDRERYRQRRENGKIKALSELPNHEQKTRRKKSRESSKKNYYKNKEKRKREACEGGAVKNNSTVSGPVAVIQSTSPSILDEQMVRQVHADNSPEPKRLKLDNRVSLRSSPPTLSLRSGDRKRASSYHRKKYKCHKNVTGTDCETPNQTDTTHHASASLISSRRASSLSSIETCTDSNRELNSAYKSRTEPRSLIPLHDFVPSTLPSPSSDSSASRSSRSRIRREEGLPRNPKIKPTRLSRIPSLRRYKYRVNKEFQLLNKRILELKAENSKNKRIINRLRQRNSKKQTRKEILSDNRTEIEKCESSSFKQNIVANSTRAMILSDMQNFYEDDENSRMCPGKRDFVTKNKVKKQKRYLNDTLLNLHTKFQKAHPEYQVSYSYFCREKPFWVQIPNVRTRETCLCQNHENFRLLVSSLNKNGIIDENSPDAVLKTLCCDASNIECLQRKCGNCKGNSLKYKEFDNSVEVHYFTWNKEKKTYTKEGIDKQTLQTVKQKVSVSPKELINKFEGIIDGYMSHVSKIIAQYRYIRKIKSELTVNQCIVHCDFSENYATKYAEEIQSFHFGSSRQQICLHTSVIYYVKNGLLTSQAFCTVSESLRHDAVAIWEHLVPIFSFLEEEVPSLESLHFITDSPTAQYRNKRMFFIMACLHWNLPSLKSVEWNYTESGHGKGAPDGVGGCIKSTADKVVARGNDIPDMDSLIKYLKQSVTNVKIEVVEESNMYEKDLLIPSDIREFKGTLSVHQVVWNADTKNILEMRKLSCSEPECLHKSKKCSHGQHIGVYDIGTAKRDTRPKNNEPKQGKSKTITKSSHKSRVIFDMEPSDLDFPEMTKQYKMSKENKNKWSKSQYMKSNGTNLSDIELSANESFWGQVSTSRVNNLITPTLGDTAFSCLEMSNKDAENSSDDDNIF